MLGTQILHKMSTYWQFQYNFFIIRYVYMGLILRPSRTYSESGGHS